MIREFLVSNFKLYNRDDTRSNLSVGKNDRKRISVAGLSEKTGTFAGDGASIGDKDSICRAPFDVDCNTQRIDSTMSELPPDLTRQDMIMYEVTPEQMR